MPNSPLSPLEQLAALIQQAWREVPLVHAGPEDVSPEEVAHALSEYFLAHGLTFGGTEPGPNPPSNAAMEAAGKILWGGLPTFSKPGGMMELLRDGLAAAYAIDSRGGTSEAPAARLGRELQVHSVAALALKEHTPRAEGSDLICECGMMFQAVDARAWHRHAASMVLNAIDGLVELAARSSPEGEG